MWTGEAFAGMACHVPLQVRSIAKPGHVKHFSFSYFGCTIVQNGTLFLSFRRTICATNILLALSSPLTAFFTDKLRFCAVLSLLMLMQMLTNCLLLRFRFRQLAHSEHLLFQKSKIKPVSTAPWFWKRFHRRRRAPPRCTSRAHAACAASDSPCWRSSCHRCHRSSRASTWPPPRRVPALGSASS